MTGPHATQRRGPGWRRRGLLAGGAAALLPAAPATAAPWPSGPLRVILVYPPGGVSDAVLRPLVERLGAALAVPCWIEHRPGAAGSLGLEALAAAAPDGQTLGFAALTPWTLVPQLRPVRYDPWRDLVPVVSVMQTPSLLVATPACDARQVPELLAAARAAPGRLRWASTGVGSTGHLVLAQLRLATGVDISHIPYPGGGQPLTDALAGRFELLSTNVGGLQLQHLAQGRLRPLAVGAPQRLASLPQVPTWAELALPQANLMSEFALLAPAGVPEAVLARVNAEVNRALASPPLQALLAQAGHLSTGGSAQALAQRLREDQARHRALLRAGAISLD